MRFLIANTFQPALGKLDNQAQKAAKMAAFELQMDPGGKGKSFHRIDRSRDKNFWSVRASRDIRLIVHKDGERMVLCYVDHHDAAYDWAERRVFEIHPKTRALQIVEVEETVETRPLEHPPEPEAPVYVKSKPLAQKTEDDLLEHGVPPSWTARLIAADEDELLDLALHLPQEAQEAVLAFAAGEEPKPPAEPDSKDAAVHPDAQRRFRFVEGEEELKAALEYPWDQWTVFLHPVQRNTAYKQYSGPARVAGSAGTGKTVVALHRAKTLAERGDGSVLLTTFSRPLARSLHHKLEILCAERKEIIPAIRVGSVIDIGAELFALTEGYEPRLAKPKDIRAALEQSLPQGSKAEIDFLETEFAEVIEGWQIETLSDYLDVVRTGRRSRLGKAKREQLWPAFQETRRILAARRVFTEPGLLGEVTARYRDDDGKPFAHVVVDEAQDLGPPELRFLGAIVADANEAMFFAGDLGQRIFQHPYSWKALGVDIRGRSSVLTVNYRTSHQIRQAADKLLPKALRDMDGVEDRRSETVSVFNGLVPHVVHATDEEAEINEVAQWVSALLADGFAPREIGIFVRSREYLDRARAVLKRIEHSGRSLAEGTMPSEDDISIGTMHFAKGLEFRAVAVMACDDEALPLQTRIETARDEADLDEIYATERHLLYVACTRARDRLLVSGCRPVSDFLRLFSN